MSREEIMENLLKSIISNRIENLEKDAKDHSESLNSCNSLIREINNLQIELEKLYKKEAPNPMLESQMNRFGSRKDMKPTVNKGKLVREKSSRTLQASSSNKNLNDSKKLERTRTVGKMNQGKTTLTQTMTSNNIKKREESVPRSTKNGKLERNATSRNPIRSGDKKAVSKNPTVKGNLKHDDLKHKNETHNIIKRDISTELKQEESKEMNKTFDPQLHINNTLINTPELIQDEINIEPPKAPELESIKTEIVENPKRSFTFDNIFTKENQIQTFLKYLNKKELIIMNSINKTMNSNVTKLLINTINNDIKSTEEKLTELREKVKDEELNKEIPPFSLGRSAVKALDLLNQEKYKEIYKSDKIPIDDVLLPYRIYFILLNKWESKFNDDSIFWPEVSKFLLSEQKTGELIANSVKSFDFSSTNIYRIYRLILNKEKKINPSYYSKICSTTGIIIFLIKDCFEYIGIIHDKKIIPTNNKVYRLYNTVINESNTCLENLKKYLK